MSRTGESRPLLRSQSTRESASVTFDDSSERPGAAAENAGAARFLTRSNSSISQVLQRFTRSERDRALQKEGVGPAAFLIRDAVLGDVENPASGACAPTGFGSSGRDSDTLLCLLLYIVQVPMILTPIQRRRWYVFVFCINACVL